MATLYEQWKDLIENQTKETFEAFWKEYSETDTRICLHTTPKLQKGLSRSLQKNMKPIL